MRRLTLNLKTSGSVLCYRYCMQRRYVVVSSKSKKLSPYYQKEVKAIQGRVTELEGVVRVLTRQLEAAKSLIFANIVTLRNIKNGD
jgi:EAL domain-containing protein (putative c-di-GMP-specific phosphodiesterase class I)